MSRRYYRRVRLPLNILAALSIVVSILFVSGMRISGARADTVAPFCTTRPQLCTETAEPWNYQGQYTGHDEPSALFYSTVPGSGNSSLYHLTLPKDPPTPPQENGSGGTWNFMLHPAFWFGMAMCDDQSAPNPGAPCPADSDQNIFASTNPNSAGYIGKTPGQGFMEMQFYPPGWGPFACDGSKYQWCAALNIDSLASNSNTGALNNSACLNQAGQEYVNWAFIQTNGVPPGPPDPLNQTAATFTPNANTLFMNPGDQLSVSLHDTPAGFRVDITDQTTGQSGYMVASAANGFGHPLFQPDAATCTDAPYTFHPMFSKSTPDTRVLWAAHSYNVSYSDEIGHFEFGPASVSTTTDPTRDSDDHGCSRDTVYGTSSVITGCTSTETDFDGPDYQMNWPGTDPNAATDAQLHAAPVTFSSPLFTGPGTSGLRNFSQVAFEADLPRIEGSDTSPNNNCQRHVSNPTDPSPGAGCVNPPNGASFYPFFSTANVGGTCMWEEGGPYVPNATNTFGGSSATAYGGLLASPYPAAGNTVTVRYNNFHNTLSNNPCPAPGAGG